MPCVYVKKRKFRRRRGRRSGKVTTRDRLNLGTIAKRAGQIGTIARVAKQVLGIVNSEHKKDDATININQSFQASPLNVIVQGITNKDRVGSSIRMKYIQLRGNIIKTNPDPTSGPLTLMIVLFPGAPLVEDDYLQSTANPYTYLKPGLKPGVVKILWRRTYTSSGTVLPSFNLNLNLKINTMAKWDTDNPGATFPLYGLLRIIAIQDPLTPPWSAEIHSRITYIDN